MSYIVIRAKRGMDATQADAQLEPYRFASQVGVTDIRAEDEFGSQIRVWISADGVNAERQADRLMSGMFGARVVRDDTELDATLIEWGVIG